MPRLSIKTKLSAVISILVLAFAVFNLVLLPATVRRQVQAHSPSTLAQTAQALAAALAPAAAARDGRAAAGILAGARQLPAFRGSAVYDAQGRLLEASPGAPPWLAEHLRDGSRAFRPQEQALVAAAPIRSGTGEVLGTLVLATGTEEITRIVNKDVHRALWVGGVAVVVAVGLGLYVAGLYIRPLEHLTAAVQQVAEGNFQGLAAGARSQDELGVLTRSFEIMTDRLKVSREEIELQNRLLESRVKERTGQLLETIWELEEIRANLERLVQERTRGLEQSRAELRAWAGTLEEKVQEKTVELTDSNDRLLASLAKLQELDRIKSEFLANMSHELRTPLNAVIGFSGLLLQERQERIPADVKVDLQIIHQNGRSLMAMIDSILDLSKIEAGRFELDLVPMDPFPVLDEVAALAGGLIGQRPIRFALETMYRKGLVLGDAERFRQVVTNLVGNAIKFTARGEVVVRAAARGDRFVVAIQDTGIGMSEAEMARLFKPFQQVDGSITRRFGGTGLGLALSQRLVMAMSGRITVASEKGLGSTFTVELPLMREEAS